MSNIKAIQKEGRIYQAISGFYYVWSDGQSYTTKPKGKFRHQQQKPLVGDLVTFEVDLNDEQSESRLIEIHERKNALVRPPVANVDFALVVMSVIEPAFSLSLLDFFLVSMESQHIQPIIVLTKIDLLIAQLGKEQAELQIAQYVTLYEKIGYTVIVKSDVESFKANIKAIVTQGLYIVMGQSGVGKSTLLNELLPNATIETAEISDYLNRGRHTTREVTLYQFYQGMLADTPGFSAIDFPEIAKEDLSHYFLEIWQESANCRFRGCQHLNEPDCAVKESVRQGQIAESRYQNYRVIYEKIEQRKPIYRKKENGK